MLSGDKQSLQAAVQQSDPIRVPFLSFEVQNSKKPPGFLYLGKSADSALKKYTTFLYTKKYIKR